MLTIFVGMVLLYCLALVCLRYFFLLSAIFSGDSEMLDYELRDANFCGYAKKHKDVKHGERPDSRE